MSARATTTAQTVVGLELTSIPGHVLVVDLGIGRRTAPSGRVRRGGRLASPTRGSGGSSPTSDGATTSAPSPSSGCGGRSAASSARPATASSHRSIWRLTSRTGPSPSEAPLWVDAASVTVEAPGKQPITLGIHEVEGWRGGATRSSPERSRTTTTPLRMEPSTSSPAMRRAGGGRNSTVLSPDG